MDVGCGSGRFACAIKDTYPNMDVVAIDPSQSLLNQVGDKRIKKSIGSLPNDIPIDKYRAFDYIHIKEVLHHIVGPSVFESKNLIKKSLISLKNYLKDDGFIFIHEIYYESWYIPTISRNFIFYILMLQNKLKIKFLPKEFLLGLEVCFYTRNEFRQVLKECGFEVVGYMEEPWENNFKKKLLLLEDWGRMIFIAKKHSCPTGHP